MLDADMMRATGESVSRWWLVGIRRALCVDCGGICTEGECAGDVCTGSSCALERSGEGSFVGGAIGNLKLDEKDPDGLRPVVGRTGVLGAVMTPGLLLGGRAGNANSFEGSCIVGGNEAPPASGEGWVAERKPGDVTAAVSMRIHSASALSLLGYEEGLFGMTCILADLPCPRLGRVGVVLPLWLPPVAASVPSEMMDIDRPCLWLLPLLPKAAPGDAGERTSPATEAAWSECAGRWPRRCGDPGMCETKDELREMDGFEEWTGGSLRWRSPPGRSPFCLRAGERSRPSGLATFLKVMVQCTSSPANTVESFHCTNTRMLDADMVGGRGAGGGGFAGGSSGLRHGRVCVRAPGTRGGAN